ncbi:MAG: helix-turn-helix transcriptional regulator [Flavobacteriaceae bacterium]|nr:helix-turn-helix transcriptional regulator [Flavobacteriaceae bacterium]
MRVLPFTIPKPQRDALIFQEDKQASFYDLLHRHKEIQISFIKKGKGTTIVGETINQFKEGDIFVLGGDLPHVFKSNISKSDTSHMVSIFFTEESFGSQFFETEELKSLKPLFKNAENGFKISKPSTSLIHLIENFESASKLKRFINFIEILRLISKSKKHSLSNYNRELGYTDNEGKRMSSVYEFTMTHFRKKISLEDIAKEAAMSKNAFCKYFKKRTRKTYITFLNELRIDEASRLLGSELDWSVAQIAEHCGFRNISNFNRKFKEVKGTSPLKFRKQNYS